MYVRQNTELLISTVPFLNPNILCFVSVLQKAEFRTFDKNFRALNQFISYGVKRNGSHFMKTRIFYINNNHDEMINFALRKGRFNLWQNITALFGLNRQRPRYLSLTKIQAITLCLILQGSFGRFKKAFRINHVFTTLCGI